MLREEVKLLVLRGREKLATDLLSFVKLKWNSCVGGELSRDGLFGLVLLRASRISDMQGVSGTSMLIGKPETMSSRSVMISMFDLSSDMVVSKDQRDAIFGSSSVSIPALMTEYENLDAAGGSGKIFGDIGGLFIARSNLLFGNTHWGSLHGERLSSNSHSPLGVSGGLSSDDAQLYLPTGSVAEFGALSDEVRGGRVSYERRVVLTSIT